MKLSAKSKMCACAGVIKRITALNIEKAAVINELAYKPFSMWAYHLFPSAPILICIVVLHMCPDEALRGA